MCHKLYLGPISLLGAQQYTTVEATAAMKTQDNSMKVQDSENSPTPAMPLVTTGATVPGLYFHIAHLVDKDEEEIPPTFKEAKPKQTRGRGKPKGKPQGHRQNPLKDQEADEAYTYDNTNNYYQNGNYTAPGQNQGCRPFTGQSDS